MLRFIDAAWIFLGVGALDLPQNYHTRHHHLRLLVAFD